MNKTLEFPNLYNLLTVVVPKYIPNEKDEFLLVGGQILQEYITRITSIKKDRGEFEFAPSVVQSLEFISLIFFRNSKDYLGIRFQTCPMTCGKISIIKESSSK